MHESEMESGDAIRLVPLPIGLPDSMPMLWKPFRSIDDFNYAVVLGMRLCPTANLARNAYLLKSEYNDQEVVIRGWDGELLCVYPADQFLLYLNSMDRLIQGGEGLNNQVINRSTRVNAASAQGSHQASQNRVLPQRPSVAGWLATILGLYLVATGVYNIIQILIPRGGGADSLTQASRELRNYGLLQENAPLVIVVSYVVGAPIFIGVTMMAVGSIARRSR